MSLTDQKRHARDRAIARRDVASAAAAGDVGSELWRHLAPVLAPNEAGAVVSGYWPMRHEIDVRASLSRLDGRGYICALPVVVGRAAPLLFRRWRPGDPLSSGPFGTRTPPETAPELTPSVVLVPLLAFDRSGRRLGYGGGYYDRTLAVLREHGEVVAVGVAFAAQEIDIVPAGENDATLDWIVTEQEAIKIERT